MNTLMISLTVYVLAANLVAGGVYVFGKEKAGLLRIEYPFIYTPWIALQLITPEFSELPGIADSEMSLKYFLFLMQGFSCGILGGMILLPRFFIRSETTWQKLKVTMISSLVMACFYLFSRYLLLKLILWVIPPLR